MESNERDHAKPKASSRQRAIHGQMDDACRLVRARHFIAFFSFVVVVVVVVVVVKRQCSVLTILDYLPLHLTLTLKRINIITFSAVLSSNSVRALTVVAAGTIKRTVATIFARIVRTPIYQKQTGQIRMDRERPCHVSTNYC